MRKALILICIGLFVLCSVGFADIPKLINYQGMLTNNSGDPLDGTFDVFFRIYNAESGGDKRWEENHSALSVSQGLFNAILGSQSGGINLDFSENYWLEVQVEGEVMPRIEFTSVGYAYRASVADSAVVAVSASTGGGWIDEGTTVRLETATDNVGIGAATPGVELEVSSTDEVDLWLNRGGKGWAAMLDFRRAGVHDWGILTPSGDTSLLIIDQNSGVVQSFLQNGNVGIGTATPGADLEVSSTDEVDVWLNRSDKSVAAALDFRRGGNHDWAILTPSGDTSLLIINQSFEVVQSFLQDGNVGIGTQNPSNEAKLHIRSATDNFGVLVDAEGTSGTEIGLHTSTGKWASLVKNAYFAGSWQRFDEGSGAFLQEIVPAGDVRFKVAGSGSTPIPWTEALTIKTSGNVGIGTTDPTEKLDIDGTARLRGIADEPGGEPISGVVMDTNGVLFRQISPSSRKYKQNIRDLNIDMEEVIRLQAVRFEWKKNGREDTGLIAEDVEKAVPDLVRYGKDGSPEGVRYDKLALYLLEALKAQQERISVLEEEIAGLKR